MSEQFGTLSINAIKLFTLLRPICQLLENKGDVIVVLNHCEIATLLSYCYPKCVVASREFGG